MPLTPQQLANLLNVNRLVQSAPTLQQAMSAIATLAANLTDCELASILTYDTEINSLRFIGLPSQHRKTLEGVSVPLDGSLAGLVYRQKQPQVVNQIITAPQHFKGIDYLSGFQTRSALVVPVLLRNEAVGVIEALNKMNGADYTGEDVAILESLAFQVGLLLENGQLRQQVQKYHRETARLDKMKNDFIAITSHELRTPLGLILGHSTFLRELVDPEYHDQLDTIIRNARRLKDIIENTTKVENVEAGTAVVRQNQVSIRGTLQDLLDSYKPEFEQKKLHLRADLGRAEMFIEGDQEKVAAIFSNLIKNAITFTNPNGQVSISAEQIPGYVKVVVKDTGVGIPAKDLDLIFERFYQVESHLTRKHGGMGLGLSVAKMFIEMHGGKLWVESVVGEGSTFTALFPQGIAPKSQKS